MAQDFDTTQSRAPGLSDAPELASEAIRQASSLIRDEVELARAEMQRKVASAALGIFLIAAAAILVLSALDVLTAAAIAALAELGLPVSIASLLIAALAVGIAVVLFLVGKSKLKLDGFAPNRAMTNIRKDIQTVKENAHV